MTAQHKSNLGDDATFIALPTDDWTKCSNPVWRIICARRILAKIITTTHGHDSTTQTTPRQEEDITCPTTHRPSDAYGDFALTVNCSGARTSAWHDKLTQCWLMLIRMSGWSASAETPHLILGSSKRPDIHAKIGDKEVLFDVRTNTVTTAGYDSVARCAATARYAAHTGAIKKHDDWDDPCFAMGYDFVALSHETGGHLAEETDEFFQQLVKHAGGGDPSDEARFRHYAATRLHLTNQIGVAKTILAHLPVTSTLRRRTRPLLGYVPLPPTRGFHREPPLPLTEGTTP